MTVTKSLDDQTRAADQKALASNVLLQKHFQTVRVVRKQIKQTKSRLHYRKLQDIKKKKRDTVKVSKN